MPSTSPDTGKAAVRIVRPAGLFRRLAAMVYDSLLLFAALYLSTAPLLLLTQGEAVALAHPLYRVYLFVVAFVFFGWFWTHGGQTLGMRAWRLRVLTRDGKSIGWLQALQRFLGAIVSLLALGLGYLWLLFDSDGYTWHDRMSKTVVVFMPKESGH